MPSGRTKARAALLLLLVWVFPGAAEAAPGPLAVPIVGPVSFSDDFGDPRGSGTHEGIDILADRRAPVVAVEDGEIAFWTTSRRAGCMLYLNGASGTTYLYVHLNNDLTRENDNHGGCVEGVAYAPGLADGQSVRAGELVGFVGDSGDADGVHPHLHFELHPGGGDAVSPYAVLVRGKRLLFSSSGGDGALLAAVRPLTLALYGTVRSAPEGTLALRVERLRTSDGRRHAVGRNVALAVTASTRLERTVAGGRTDARLDGLTPGEEVVVWTEAVRPGLAGQIAAPGVLAAAHVLFRGVLRAPA